MNIRTGRSTSRRSIGQAARRIAERLQGQDVERRETISGHRLGRNHAALQNAHLSQGVSPIGLGR